MQVRKLEKVLGIPLFHQVGKQVQLTEGGRLLAEYANRISQMEKEAERAVAELRGLSRGLLRVGASTTPGAYLLPRVLSNYKGRYPGIELDLQIANTRAIEAQVLQGALDCGVIGEEAGGTPDLEVEPLVRDTLVVLVAPHHPLNQSGGVTLDQLLSHSFVLREPGSSTREVLERRLRALGRTVRPELELGTPEAVKEAVAAGLGIGVVSRLAVQWELATGRLTAVPVEGLTLERELNLIFHRGRRLTGAAQAFIQLLKDWTRQDEQARPGL